MGPIGLGNRFQPTSIYNEMGKRGIFLMAHVRSQWTSLDVRLPKWKMMGPTASLYSE